MRKSESGTSWSRLSSSTSSIRGSNYTPSRSYGSSLSSYRYTPSYTSPQSYSTPYGGGSGSATADRSLTRSSTTHSATSRSLTRSESGGLSSGLGRTTSSTVTPSYHSSRYSSSASSTRTPYSSSTYSTPSSYQRDSSFSRNAPERESYASRTLERTRDTSYAGQASMSQSTDVQSILNSPKTVSAKDHLGRPRASSQIITSGYRWEDKWERESALRQLSPRRAEGIEEKALNGNLRSSTTLDNLHLKGWRDEEEEATRAASKIPQPPALPQYLHGTTPATRAAPAEAEALKGAVARSPSPPARSYLKKEVVHRDLVAEYTRKPTAKVSPYAESGHVVEPGFTGLRNLGNTCFMNATLQMLVNCAELKAYFLSDLYKQDVNEHNVLGFGGRLARAFAQFLQQMWSCSSKTVEPQQIKEIVAEKASQFANYAQHDAQEFLCFLIDGLHEDLNRCRTKMVTSQVEADGRPDREVSAEAWRSYLLRNNSLIVDLFHGQLKSRLECPKCSRVSITFDPFLYLAVPFPKKKKSVKVHFWPLDPCLRPFLVPVSFSPEGTVADFLAAVGEVVKQPGKQLRLLEIVQHRIHKVYTNSEATNLLNANDLLYVFQVHDASDWNEEVVEIYAVQRQLYAHSLKYICNTCGSTEDKLKACEACYNAWYCDQDCQLKDWNDGNHKTECGRRPIIDAVGLPMLISLPRSHLTYAHLARVLDARSRHSINVFLPPQLNKDPGHEGELSPAPGESGLQNGGPSSEALIPNGLDKKSLSPSASSSGSELRRQVMPAPRKKAPPALFVLKKIRSQNSSVGDTIRETTEEAILDLPTGSYVSINWVNIKNGKPFVEVEDKASLALDEALTAKYAPSTTSRNTDGDPSLEDMIQMFSETERLKPEESWYCSRCKDHVEATKKLELYRLPPVIIIQLKRFVYTASAYATSSHRRSKDDRRVEYPLAGLDLAPYLAEGADVGQNTVYDLTGVVCHSGTSYFGHYVSIGRLPGIDGRTTQIDWRTFDDSTVTQCRQPEVQSSEAYLLFYKQRGTATRDLFREHYKCDPVEDQAPFVGGRL
ncbi:unnamed protein product, partial [Mesorhabditis spiculigera]